MIKKYKTFKDLKFKEKDGFTDILLSAGFGSGCNYTIPRIAQLSFKNGYGVSVIDGAGSYTNQGEFELAVFKHGHLCYDTPITDDVLGHLLPLQITKIMKEVQDLPKAKKVKK